MTPTRPPVVRPLHQCEYCGWYCVLQPTTDPYVFEWACFHGHRGTVAYATTAPPPEPPEAA